MTEQQPKKRLHEMTQTQPFTEEGMKRNRSVTTAMLMEEKHPYLTFLKAAGITIAATAVAVPFVDLTNLYIDRQNIADYHENRASVQIPDATNGSANTALLQGKNKMSDTFNVTSEQECVDLLLDSDSYNSVECLSNTDTVSNYTAYDYNGQRYEMKM